MPPPPIAFAGFERSSGGGNYLRLMPPGANSANAISINNQGRITGYYLDLSRLSWKWRKRSSVKIAERTYEKRAQALHC